MRHLEVLLEELPPHNQNCPVRRQVLGSCKRSVV